MKKVYILTVLLIVVMLVSSIVAYAGITEIVSVSSDGVQGNFTCTPWLEESRPSISSDGKFVAFNSEATNLVSGDTNGRADIFVRDRQTDTTVRVSISSDGVQAGNYSYSPSISANGRFVAFVSLAGNLVLGDTNGSWDIFVYDMQTGTIERVSVSSDGKQTGPDNYFGNQQPTISADGRFVAFNSPASNLVSDDTNEQIDTFVHDRQTCMTERVSVSSDGKEANEDCQGAISISADGRFVAFYSEANNLVTGDTNGCYDVFVHDRQNSTTERVNISSDGTQANNESNNKYPPSISADGRFVVFTSTATNLVSGYTYLAEQVFVHDRQAGTTELVSKSSNGVQGNGSSKSPSISADGRFVAFSSDAYNLVTNDNNNSTDVFVNDRQTGETKLASVSSDGVQGNGVYSSISADGKVLVFVSSSPKLVSGDTNNNNDVFVHEMDSVSIVPVTSVSLNKTSLLLKKGGTETLVATVNPSNANNKAVTWASDNEGIATVDTSGKVTAVSDGDCTITVTTADGGKTATCLVTVSASAIAVTDVSLNKTTLSLLKGASETLVATVNPNDATNKAVTWESDNTAVATVNSSGLVTAKSAGNCTITVTTVDGGFTETCYVTVSASAIPVTGVSLDQTTIYILKGASETLVATVNPSNATNKAVKWSSSKNAVATVDTNGVVTAVGGGSCAITVKTVNGSKTANCQVNVEVPVESVELNNTSIFLSQGSFKTLVATVNPSDATNKAVTWKSSNTDVATVNASGKVTAIGGGTCIITITTKDGSKTADCSVDVPSMIYFTSPTLADSYDSFAKIINIGGKSDSSITKASWQIDSKRKGSCKISNGNWNANKIGLVLGNNLITVTGINKNKQTYTDTLLVRYIDNIKPEVKINAKPTSFTTKGVITISGSAKDLETIAKVTWANSATGKNGVCTGTKSWKALGVILALGNNEITVSAEDSSGNIGTSKIVVIRADKTKPKVVITIPTSKTSLNLNAETINLGGTSSDDVEVKKIEWLNKSTGASGVCAGTNAWSANTIPLQIGKNNIVITATDTSGNKATDSISVSRKF